MTDALTSLDMSTGLHKVADRAKREPAARFHSLAHLIDEELLAGAFARLRGNAAVGVDGITKEQYGQDLQSNLRDLYERLKSKRYRHQPIRRVHIPKEKKGQTRPIGISITEDKVVQTALREVLAAVYEQTFMDCSYGFRPGRSAHDAVRALTRAVDEGEANWILEFDVVSFFDSVRRSQLMEMLQERVADGSLLRLVGKCLHVGVLDGEEFTEPSEGTIQGSTLSPLLGSVYLHTVLDRWFTEEVRPRLRGKATFIRYADDGVFGFERQDDAQRVQAALSKRMERFGPCTPRRLDCWTFVGHHGREVPAGVRRRSISSGSAGITDGLVRAVGRWRARPGVHDWRGPYSECMRGVERTGTFPSSSSTRSS